MKTISARAKLFVKSADLFGSLSLIVSAFIIAVMPMTSSAATTGSLTVLINGEPPTGYCVAGPITVSGNGITGGQGSDWHLIIGWGDGSASTTSDGTPSMITSGSLAGNPPSGTAFTYSATHTPVGASSGITVILYHVQPSGQDGQVIVVNQCVAPPTQGVVILAKHVINDSGTGHSVAGDFTLTINGTNVTGSESGATPGVLLDAGTYSITETGPDGYTQTGVICGDGQATTTSDSVTVIAGHNYSCTITNDDNAPAPDTTPPVVTISPPAQTVEATGPSGATASFTATATDDVDGSLTPSCDATSGQTFALGTTTITCSATDSSHNSATSTATVTVVDTTPPVITLNGNATLNLTVGDTFTDPGATAADLVDVTDPVTVGGDTVDTNTPGTYTITYNAVDNAENHATQVTRTVVVSEAPITTAQLTLHKIVDNTLGGEATATDWTLTASGSTTSISGVDGAAAITDATVTPDTYALSESGSPANYTPSAWTCTNGITVSEGHIALAAGDSTECSITNTFTPPAPTDATVTIVKNVVGGADGTFTFTGLGEDKTISTVGGTGSTTVTVDASTTQTIDLAETVPAGYSLEGGHPSCVYENQSIGTPSVTNGEELVLSGGDSVTCTFTDDAVIADLSMTKTVDNASPKPGDSVTFTLTESNAGPADASGVSVEDILPAGLVYVSNDGAESAYNSGTGVWTIGSLAHDAQATLHIMATIATDTPAGTVITNTATTTLADEVVSDDNAANDAGSASVTVASNATPTPKPTPSNTGGGGGGRGGGGCGPGFAWNATTHSCVPVGQVLGAATSTPQLGVTCGIYLNQHLRMGSPKNNADQVTKLQQFLVKHGYGTFTPTGYFGPLTFAAVKAFQEAYAEAILVPWNIKAPTGLVYLTTTRQVDLVECPDLMIPMPELVPWNQNPNAQ